MNNRNLGRVEISRELIEDEPERAAEVFKLLNFVPVRAECLFYNGTVEYIAISDRFETVPEGNLIPEYKLDISEDEDGKIASVKAEKV